jgi:hypothetical protein
LYLLTFLIIYLYNAKFKAFDTKIIKENKKIKNIKKFVKKRGKKFFVGE